LLAWEMGGTSLQERRDTFRRLSPVQYLEQVALPCLILHGEADDRCPISQGEEFFNGLRALGKPAEMVRYPGQGHLFRSSGRPSHRRDYYERTLDWIERHTPGAHGTPAEQAAAAVG
jgi:dipeptidyl aminopeptidase/acylaminoacyl peptidase